MDYNRGVVELSAETQYCTWPCDTQAAYVAIMQDIDARDDLNLTERVMEPIIAAMRLHRAEVSA